MSNAKDTQDVSQERIDKTSRSEETDGYEKSSGQRQASWPHWYQNEPYYSRRPGFEQSTGGRFDSDNEQWEEQRHYQPRDNTHESPSSLVLILMRGLPGSGKSTLARYLFVPSGLILSTDDYFAHRDGYCYEPGLLGKAHEWNQSRAKDGMHQGRSPIIIDNTNIQAWEMKPYVKMALESGYRVDFCEPDTSWKFDPYELERRNKHGVPQDKISQMLDRFSFPISIDIVMSSEDPPHVNQRHRPRSDIQQYNSVERSVSSSIHYGVSQEITFCICSPSGVH
uniref:Uncharacterized protein n=1 Tax=Anabas testudineus TaxID=64144 RepID=A0A3Q1I9V1_ANATE